MAKQAFEHKENTGSMFTNDNKNQETHPDFTGQINIGGELYRVAAWENPYGDGALRIAMKFETEEEFQSRKEANTGGGGGGAKGGSASKPQGRAASAGSRRPAARR